MAALSEVKEKVSQLENAIKRLDYVKKHLSQNASDMKAEIHANVSRNLECLRGREVSLLKQVDQVLSVKEETLQRQQARLNQALGVLQTGLSMVEDDTASEKQLKDTLAKLSRIELSPVETPYIAFRADHVSLRESILNYGRVDANGLPLITAFDDPGNPSASLPRHVEEYEDADHHVFYKTVEEVKKAKSSASCINVTIPKLSTRVEDWLQKKVPYLCTKGADSADTPVKHMPAVRPSTLTKSGENVTLNSSRSCTPGSSCSLNNWLSIIKQHADLEEEHDFEIIDNSSSRKAVAPKERVAHGDNAKVTVDFFQHIEKDVKAWLKPGTSTTMTKLPSDFFRHIPKDTKMWLMQACRQLTSLDDLKQRDFFHHISREPSTWLRSRAHGKQQVSSQEGKDGADFFSHISKNTELWLVKGTKQNCGEKEETAGDVRVTDGADPKNKHLPPKMSISDEEAKWLMCCSANNTSFQLEDVCRANELCGSLSECVSKPDCVTMCLREKAAAKNAASPPFLFKPLHLPPLAAEEEPEKSSQGKGKGPDAGSAVDFFHHIPEISNSVWLSKPNASPSKPPPASPPSVMVKDDKEETNLWLQKTKSSTSSPEPSTVPESRGDFMVADFTLSDWLLVPAPAEKKEIESKQEEEGEREKEDCEGWSVCSDAHSISSDQHVKDVAAASDYFDKWLM